MPVTIWKVINYKVHFLKPAQSAVLHINSVFVCFQSHDRLQVYGGHSDMVMCMAVHKSVVSGLKLVSPYLFESQPACKRRRFHRTSMYVLIMRFNSVYADLHGLLWWKCQSSKAQLDEELPLLGKDIISISFSTNICLHTFSIYLYLFIWFPSFTCKLTFVTVTFAPPVQWQNCSLIFGMAAHLQQHLIGDHSNPNLQTVKCRWRGCSAFFSTQQQVRQVMNNG